MYLKDLSRLFMIFLGVVLLFGFSNGQAYCGQKEGYKHRSEAVLKHNPNNSEYFSFFELYTDNSKQGIPNYITEDFLLLSYSLLRQKTVKSLEMQVLMPEFRKLLNSLSTKMADQDKDAVTKANLEFIKILQALLEGKTSLEAADRSVKEFKLVLEADGIKQSPLWGHKMDYSRFAPRGAYTESKERKAYFRAMKYASGVFFAVKESEATGISKKMAGRMTDQAWQIVSLIQDDEELKKTYKSLNKHLKWRFGPADDLVMQDILAVAEKISPKQGQDFSQGLLEYAKKHERQPSILSGLVRRDALEKGLSPKDVLTGWRLLPQRRTPNAAAFQELVYDRVGEYLGDKEPFSLTVIQGRPVKGFPLVSEIMALLGSDLAEKELESGDEQNFKGYAKAWTRAGEALAKAPGLCGWQQGLLQTWLGAQGRHVPDEKRRLTSAKSFWTWQRYLGVLYAKQSTTITSKGLSKNKPCKTAYIEPAVELYLVLGQLVDQHRKINPNPVWDKFKAIIDKCLQISWAELKGRKLGEDEVSFLNSLDLRIKGLTGGKDHPIVVDVHTVPSSKQILEEAIGLPRVVYKELPGKNKARGALFTHYEFKQPMKERLTDEKWMEKLERR